MIWYRALLYLAFAVPLLVYVRVQGAVSADRYAWRRTRKRAPGAPKA